MKLTEQTRQEAARWFAAQRRGPMAVEERQAFDHWRADPINQAALNSMHEVWGEVAGIGQLGVEVPRRRRWPQWAAAAAGLVAILGSASLYFALPISEPEPQHRVATAVGEQRTTTLPDGSVVSANVVTRLAYDVGQQRRSVALEEGEAAFFVRKDRTRPFVVSAAGYEIEAIGTAFNVRNRGGQVDVAVIEGIVTVRAVTGPFAGQEIRRLEAGRRIALGPVGALAGATIPVSTVQTQSVAEWRMRTLSYEDVPVSRVVSDLNLYFERPIEISDPALAARHLTIRLQVDDRERALSTLASLLQAQIRRTEAADILDI